MKQSTATQSPVLPVLTGQSVYLRPITLADVSETYCAWLNDPEVNQYLETRFEEQTLESVAGFIRQKANRLDEPFFAICLRENDKHIGNIKLGPINSNHRHGDVSLFIGDKSEWGKGYATEAIGLITHYAFQQLGLNKLKAGCYGQNFGSAHAFEKCGYVREGLLKGHFLSEGRETDMIVLGLRAADYKKRRL